MCPVSRHGGNGSVRDFADARVPAVGDVKVAGGIHGDAVGIGQLGAGGRTVVAAKALRPVSRYGGDDPIRHLADAGVTGVGDVQVAGGIHRDAVGIKQLGAGRRTAIAEGCAASRHGRDHATRNLADAVIIRIGDVEVAGGIHGDASGIVQLGAGGLAVTAIACRSVSRHGGHRSVRDFADAVVIRIGDVQVAGGIHGDAFGIVQLDGRGRALTAVACRSVSRHGGDDRSVGKNLADALVIRIGDVQVESRIHGDASGRVQLGAGGQSVVAAESFRPVSRHRGDRSIENHADALVRGVGDVQVAGGIHGDALGILQLGAGGRAVVAAVARRPVSRHGGDESIGDLADAVVPRVGDVDDAAGGIHGDAGGRVQLGAGGRAVVAAVASRSVSRYQGQDTACGVPSQDNIFIREEEVACPVRRYGTGWEQAGGRSCDIRRQAAASERVDRVDLAECAARDGQCENRCRKRTRSKYSFTPVEVW